MELILNILLLLGFLLIVVCGTYLVVRNYGDQVPRSFPNNFFYVLFGYLKKWNKERQMRQ